MKSKISLLVFFLTPVLCLVPNTALAQTGPNGAFGGTVVKASSINDDLALFVGGRGGWIMNVSPAHAFVVGGGGYGLATDVEIQDVGSAGESANLKMGYGGLELEYINRSNSQVHFSVYSLVGAGGVGYREGVLNSEGESDDAFFIAEPGVNAMFNVNDVFRIGAGVSYRLISDINLVGVSNSDIGGIAGVVTFKFGSF